MTVEITMPDLSTTEDFVTVLEWLVEEGDNVEIGDPLVEIETDKATMEVEAIASGIIVSIQAQVGDQVKTGQIIALIDDGKTATTSTIDESAQSSAPVMQPVTTTKPVSKPRSSDRISLFARNKARREKQSMFTNDDVILLSAVQRETARRLQISKSTVPHYYLNTSADAASMIAQRESASEKLLWDAFFVKAVATALRDYERLTYRFDEDKLVRISNAIGVAADLDGDLFVIPVNNAHTKSVTQISSDIQNRLERIKAGDPAARHLEKTAMTITNLGMENIESFTAVINPPEAAILAIGKIMAVPFAINNSLTIQERVNMTLAVDHRVANGRYAAKFLGKIVDELENF